jgi:hypothetical protein
MFFFKYSIVIKKVELRIRKSQLVYFTNKKINDIFVHYFLKTNTKTTKIHLSELNKFFHPTNQVQSLKQNKFLYRSNKISTLSEIILNYLYRRI